MKILFKITIYWRVGVAMLCTAVVLQSCDNKQPISQPKYESETVPRVVINRFDRDLFSTTPQNLENDLTSLLDKYGDFYYSYASDILAMPDEGDSLFARSIRLMLSYQPLIDLYKTVDSAYTDMSEIENQLTAAIGVYKKQLPQLQLPTFTTFISEFGYANVIYENKIGIGLDMFLKERFRDTYIALDFPDFMIRKLSRPYIVPYTLKALGTSIIEDQNTRDRRFLATMLVEGKIRYFMKALLPQLHDTLIMGYTANQLNWCYENESQIWKHFIEKEILFKNEPSQFIRYFTDGPFTSADGVPPESAPMIGTFIGLQIVRHYIKNNPNVSLQELVFETDFDKILKLSKYRP
jgi:hypothetical protein